MVNPLDIQNKQFEQVTVSKPDIFDGYEVNFSVENQRFVFLIGNTASPFPLNIKHVFKEKENCRQCGKLIYPAPFGQQLCESFGMKKQELLSYFKGCFPQQFK